MSKKDKLIDRFLSIPSDFTWDELVNVLSSYGFKEQVKGKTGGSRRRFIDVNKNVITLHKPHPSAIIKKYAIRIVIADLKEYGCIKNE